MIPSLRTLNLPNFTSALLTSHNSLTLEKFCFICRTTMESRGLCTGVLLFCLFGLISAAPLPDGEKPLTEATSAELDRLGIGSTESFRVNGLHNHFYHYKRCSKLRESNIYPDYLVYWLIAKSQFDYIIFNQYLLC